MGWIKINWKSSGKQYKQVGENASKKWDSTKFSESHVSQELLDYFKEKFPRTVVPIALFKCLPMVSCKLDRPRVSFNDVAPSRHLKTYTSNEAMRIFSKEFWINTQSDFTMNSLKRYKEELKQSKCLMINDATTLFASKSQRFKARLVGGLSELLTDEIYTYQNYKEKFTLRGKISLNMNMTSESYKYNKNNLLGWTFSERVLTIHHTLTKPEMDAWVAKQQKTMKMRFKATITIDDIETDIQKIPRHYLKLIKIQAREFSYLSLRSFIGTQDLIKGIVRAHAALNKRREVCTDDFALVSMIKGYLLDPFSPYEGQIVKLRARGLSYRGICKKIGKTKNYIHQVQKVVKRAQVRGILPLENKLDQIMKNER